MDQTPVNNRSIVRILPAGILTAMMVIPLVVYVIVHHALIAEPLPIGSIVPSATLTDLNGKTILSDSLLEDRSIFVFFSPTCPHCEKMLLSLDQVYRQNGDRFRMFAITNSPENTLRKYIERNQLSIPIMVDTSGKIQELYKVTTVPKLFMIDSNKVLVDVRTGEISIDTILSVLLSDQLNGNK